MKVQHEGKLYRIEFGYGETVSETPHSGANTTKQALLTTVRGVGSLLAGTLKMLEAGTSTAPSIAARIELALGLINNLWSERREWCSCTIRDVTDFRRDPDPSRELEEPLERAPVVAFQQVTRYHDDVQNREKQRKAALAAALDGLFPPYAAQNLSHKLQRSSSPEHRAARKLFWQAYLSRKAIRNHLDFLRKLEHRAQGGAEV